MPDDYAIRRNSLRMHSLEQRVQPDLGTGRHAASLHLWEEAARQVPGAQQHIGASCPFAAQGLDAHRWRRQACRQEGSKEFGPHVGISPVEQRCFDIPTLELVKGG